MLVVKVHGSHWMHFNSLGPSDTIWRWRSWSGNDGTKPLPEPMLTYYQWSPVAFIWGHYHKNIWRYQSVKQDWRLHLKITIRSPRGQWVVVSMAAYDICHTPMFMSGRPVAANLFCVPNDILFQHCVLYIKYVSMWRFMRIVTLLIV